jgi:hypothetical protein
MDQACPYQSDHSVRPNRHPWRITGRRKRSRSLCLCCESAPRSRRERTKACFRRTCNTLSLSLHVWAFSFAVQMWRESTRLSVRHNLAEGWISWPDETRRDETSRLAVHSLQLVLTLKTNGALPPLLYSSLMVPPKIPIDISLVFIRVSREIPLNCTSCSYRHRHPVAQRHVAKLLPAKLNKLLVILLVWCSCTGAHSRSEDEKSL